WTAGEIGTISAAIGILVRFLADHSDLQRKLRADPSLLPYAIDEILRIHGPQVTNRRVTRCPVELGGKKLKEGERVTINWVSANRDEEVFEEAETFKFGRDVSKNLLYGAGIHVCPGAPLARLRMRLFMGRRRRESGEIRLDESRPEPAAYPASGFATVMVRIQ